MKNKTDYFPYETYCLRLPAFSIERLVELNTRLQDADLSNPENVLQLIDHLFSSDLFREAIFTSSMDLYSRFEKARAAGQISIEELQRFLISFYKYYSRMSHRATPYGLFAGVAAGSTLGEQTAFRFDPDKQKIIFQFNIQVITELLRRLNADLSFAQDERITYYVNNTLYTIKDKAYFVEKTDGNNGYQVSNLTSVSLNEHLERIIERVRNGSTFQELVDTITLSGATEQQKRSYVHNLIVSQILVNDFWPSVSGHDFMGTFLKKVADTGIEHPYIDELKQINQLFWQSQHIDGIQAIRQVLQSNDFSIAKINDFYRVDMFHKLAENKLSRKVVNSIQRTSYELMKISMTDFPAQLERFKQNFHAKYESREIPLVMALDPNYGVGYGLAVNGVSEFTPLVDGIPIEQEQDNRIPFNRRIERIRSNAKKSYYTDKKTSYRIDDEVADWLKEIEQNDSEFRNRRMTSVYCFGSISASSIEALDRGEFNFRPSQTHAPYATRLLSRFTHGQDEMYQLVRQIADDEQTSNPQAILAEVVYIPDGKYANISLTGQLRQFEITYSSTSTLNEENRLDINDLMVSIRDGQVVLRSKRLNKEVIPSVSNTYDASFANPIYQFFSDMNYQHVNHGFYWNWSIADNSEPFLPRIEYKQFILSRARWAIQKKALNYTDFEFLKKYFDALRIETGMPRYVVIPEGDNELLIDLDNNICQVILAKEINRNGAILLEFLNTPENCFISDGNDKYCNEVIIPLGTKSPFSGSTEPMVFDSSEDSPQRVFQPGSEWLYFKIFSGTKILEELIPQVLGPFCEEHLASGTIDQWFFIRYDESGYHIRLRLHRSPTATDEQWLKIIPSFQKAIQRFNPDEQVIRWSIDTYQREIERYNKRHIELSERIFCADSRAIASFLDLISGNEGEEYRWKFALISIDYLLTDFGYYLEDKALILGDLSENFFREFIQHSSDKGKFISKILRARYREHSDAIRYMLSEGASDPEMEDGYACFVNRSAQITDELNRFGVISRTEKYHLLYSYIHMLMNRLFIVNQRKHELVIYHYLNHYYESAIARQKKNSNEYATR